MANNVRIKAVSNDVKFVQIHCGSVFLFPTGQAIYMKCGDELAVNLRDGLTYPVPLDKSINPVRHTTIEIEVF